MINLFDDIPTYTGGEIFTDVLLRQAFVSSGSSRLVSPRRWINHIVKDMTNGSCSSPARRVSALRAKVSVIFVRATTS